MQKKKKQKKQKKVPSIALTDRENIWEGIFLYCGKDGDDFCDRKTETFLWLFAWVSGIMPLATIVGVWNYILSFMFCSKRGWEELVTFLYIFLFLQCIYFFFLCFTKTNKITKT